MLVKAVDENGDAVVPELDSARVQTGQNPWALGMERQTLDAMRLGLKLGEDPRARNRIFHGVGSLADRARCCGAATELS